jgi:GntP family gluconate:H+ symporter
VLSILLLPLVLIFMDTGLNTLSVMGVIDKGADWVNVLRMVGKTPVALLITVLYALWLFRQTQGKVQLEKFCNDALAPVCAVILVTGAGGMFGGVLRASGIGTALMAPTVAATAGLSDLDLTFIVIAIAGGATVLSHFNDSGFWLVSRFLNMDEKTTLKTWTVMETLLGTIAFLIVAMASIVF